MAIQEARYEAAMKDLNKAQMHLDEKQAELEAVQAQYNQAMIEKQVINYQSIFLIKNLDLSNKLKALVDDANNCRHKMTTARSLIDGLSGEKIRWSATSKTFEQQIHNLVGDVLMAGGFLSYAGPFNQEYRKILLTNWKNQILAANIPLSKVHSVKIKFLIKLSLYFFNNVK